MRTAGIITGLQWDTQKEFELRETQAPCNAADICSDRLWFQNVDANTARIVFLSDNSDTVLPTLRDGTRHPDAFAIEVVRHYRALVAHQPMRQGKVKHIPSIDFLRPMGHDRIPEGQFRRLEALDVFQTSDVELHFPVKCGNGAIEIGAVALANFINGAIWHYRLACRT
jgi:hypothetical protein